jgi:hypothetical protein
MAATTPTFFGGAIALGIFLAAVPRFARTQVLVFDAATVKAEQFRLWQFEHRKHEQIATDNKSDFVENDPVCL